MKKIQQLGPDPGCQPESPLSCFLFPEPPTLGFLGRSWGGWPRVAIGSTLWGHSFGLQDTRTCGQQGGATGLICAPEGLKRARWAWQEERRGHLGHRPGPLASPKLGRGSTVWVGVQEVGGVAPCVLGSSGSVSRISGCARGCIQIDGESPAQSRGESGGQGQPWGSRGRALPARLSVILCSPGAQPCVSFL